MKNNLVKKIINLFITFFSGILMIIFGLLTIAILMAWYFLLAAPSSVDAFSLIFLQGMLWATFFIMLILIARLVVKKKPFIKFVPVLIIITFTILALIYFNV